MEKTQSGSRTEIARRALLLGAGAAVGAGFVSKLRAQAPAPGTPAPGSVTPAPAASPSAPGTVVLPALPYPEKALEPYVSATTLSFHYGKHHKAYVEKTNALVQGTPFVGKPLEDIVRRTAKSKTHQKLYNNAAQVLNHNWYWQSMKPGGGGAPTGELLARVEKDFGSYEAFKEAFAKTALDHFSNGWVWLVLDAKNKLKIADFHDADTPVVHGLKPLLVTDVWEHAYYLDYKNARKDYVTAFLDHLLNWELVAAQLA